MSTQLDELFAQLMAAGPAQGMGPEDASQLDQMFNQLVMQPPPKQQRQSPWVQPEVYAAALSPQADPSGLLPAAAAGVAQGALSAYSRLSRIPRYPDPVWDAVARANQVAGPGADKFNIESQAIQQGAQLAAEDDWLPDISQAVSGVTSSLATGIPAGMAGGPAGWIGDAATRAYDMALTRGQQAGLSGGKLHGYAASQAAPEAIIAGVFQRFAPGLEKYFAKEGAKQAAKRGIAAALKQLGIRTAQEIPEELLIEGSQSLSDYVSGVDPEALTAENLGESAYQVLLQTAMMTGTVAAPSVYRGAQESIEARRLSAPPPPIDPGQARQTALAAMNPQQPRQQQGGAPDPVAVMDAMAGVTDYSRTNIANALRPIFPDITRDNLRETLGGNPRALWEQAQQRPQQQQETPPPEQPEVVAPPKHLDFVYRIDPETGDRIEGLIVKSMKKGELRVKPVGGTRTEPLTDEWVVEPNQAPPPWRKKQQSKAEPPREQPPAQEKPTPKKQPWERTREEMDAAGARMTRDGTWLTWEEVLEEAKRGGAEADLDAPLNTPMAWELREDPGGLFLAAQFRHPNGRLDTLAVMPITGRAAELYGEAKKAREEGRKQDERRLSDAAFQLAYDEFQASRQQPTQKADPPPELPAPPKRKPLKKPHVQPVAPQTEQPVEPSPQPVDPAIEAERQRRAREAQMQVEQPREMTREEMEKSRRDEILRVKEAVEQHKQSGLGSDIGIRALHPDEESYVIGEKLPESVEWVDDVRTDRKLGGTAAFRPGFEEDAANYFAGKVKLAIIKGEDIGDPSGTMPEAGAAIFRNAEIVDIIDIPPRGLFRKSVPEQQPVAQEEPAPQKQPPFAETRKAEQEARLQEKKRRKESLVRQIARKQGVNVATREEIDALELADIPAFKQTHLMSRDEYAEIIGDTQFQEGQHTEDVADAIDYGEYVPERVLAEHELSKEQLSKAREAQAETRKDLVSLLTNEPQTIEQLAAKLRHRTRGRAILTPIDVQQELINAELEGLAQQREPEPSAQGEAAKAPTFSLPAKKKGKSPEPTPALKAKPAKKPMKKAEGKAKADDAERNELIEKTVRAFAEDERSRIPRLQESIELEGTDGKWYRGMAGFPSGVKWSGNKRVAGYLRVIDGAMHGPLYKTEEEARAAVNAKAEKAIEDYRKYLESATPTELRESAEMWAEKAARKQEARDASRTPKAPPKQKTKKKKPLKKPLGTGSPESDQRLANYRERKKAGRLLGSEEPALEALERQAKANPSKWSPGDGVGYRIARQINRGFRVVRVDADSKMALIRQVADTGITVTGGDFDRIGDQWIPIGDLVRDRKYDAPQAKAAPKKPMKKQAAPEPKKDPEKEGRKGKGGMAFEGPAPTPLEMVQRTPKEPEPVGPAQILDHMRKTFNVPIRFGKFDSLFGKRLGIYKWYEHVVRLGKKHIGNIGLAAHEVAHHIDRVSEFIAKAPVRVHAELQRLDYDRQKARDREGFAEFMRHYLTMDDADVVAPDTYAYFQSWLRDPANKKWADGIRSTKEMIDRYRNQTAEERYEAARSKTGRPDVPVQERIRRVMRKIGEHMADRFQATEKAQRWLEENKGGPLSRDIYKTARVLASREGRMAEEAIRDGIYSIVTNQKMHDGLADQLRVLGKLTPKEFENFVSFMQARHDMDVLSQKKDPGVLWEDAKAILDKYRHKKEWWQAADGVTSWHKALIDMLAEASNLSPEAAQSIKDSWPSYVPLKRVMDEGEGFAPSPPKGRKDRAQQPVKRLKGSARQRIDPLAASQQMAVQFYRAAIQNHVRLLIFDEAQNVEGAGWMVERIEDPKRLDTLTLGSIAPQLKALGVDLDTFDELDMTALLTLTRAGDYGTAENIHSVYRNGKIEWYQLDPELHQALMNMGRTQPRHWVLRFANSITQVTRLGATGIKPAFGIIMNPTRDIVDYMMKTDGNPYTAPFRAIAWNMRLAMAGLDWATESIQLPEGMRRPLRKASSDPLIHFFRRFGGELSGFIGQDIGSAYKQTRDLINDIEGRKRHNIVLHPVDFLQRIVSFQEYGPRLAEIEVILKKAGLTVEMVREGAPIPMDLAVEAMFAGQEATIDFTRGGTTVRAFNLYDAFTNAAVQGPLQAARKAGLKGVDPRKWDMKMLRRTTIRGAQFLTVPTLLYWFAVKDEEWYEELPGWRRFFFWNFRAFDRTWSIPRPFDFGLVFAAVPEATAHSIYKGDDKYMRELLVAAFQQYGGLLEKTPDAIQPLLEVMTGLDFWRDKQIVDKYLQDTEEPEGQFYEYTSSFSKALGEKFGMSPAKLDHLLAGYSGGMALNLVKTYDEGLAPLLGGRVLTMGFERGASIDEFYDRRTEVSQQRGTAKRKGTLTPELEREYRKFNDIGSLMKTVRDHGRSEDIDEQHRHNRWITALARFAMGKETLNKEYPLPFNDPETPEALKEQLDLWVGSKVIQATENLRLDRKPGEPLAEFRERIDERARDVDYAKSMLNDLGLSMDDAIQAFLKRWELSGNRVYDGKRLAEPYARRLAILRELYSGE